MYDILENEFVSSKLKKINEIQNELYMSDHGLGHAIEVARFSENLCNLLSLSSSKCVEAAIIHDIAYVKEKDNHAHNAYLMLIELGGFSKEVLNAVRYHSELEEIYSYEGAILAICDKIHLNKTRLLPKGLLDDFHSRILGNIENTVITATGNIIVINYETSGVCDLYLYEKYFKVLNKGFAFLGVDYDVRINNISIIGGINEA